MSAGPVILAQLFDVLCESAYDGHLFFQCFQRNAGIVNTGHAAAELLPVAAAAGWDGEIAGVSSSHSQAVDQFAQKYVGFFDC